jgi:hypothetical protein
VAQQPNSVLGRLNVVVSRSHTIRHARTVGLLCTSDRLVAEAATYTNTEQTQEKKIHALSRIRTRDSSNVTTLDLRLRRQGHRVWQSREKVSPNSRF